MTGPEDRAVILAIERLEALLRVIIEQNKLVLKLLTPKHYPKSTSAHIQVN